MTLFQIPEKYNRLLKDWKNGREKISSLVLNVARLSMKNNCVRLINNRLLRSERPNHEQDWTVTITLYQYRTPEALQCPDPVCHDFDSEYQFTHDVKLQHMSFWVANVLGVRQEMKLNEMKWMTVLMSSHRYYYLINPPPLAERRTNDELGH